MRTKILPVVGRCAVLLAVAMAIILPSASLDAASGEADWPQYRGPNGDGTTDDKILTTWPAEGPKKLWQASVPVMRPIIVATPRSPAARKAVTRRGISAPTRATHRRGAS